MITIMRVLLMLFFLQADARVLFESAEKAQQAGRLAEAQRLLESAAKLAPGQVAILGNLGAIRAQRGDFAGALSVYEQALKINPATPRLHLNIALAHFRQSDFAAALTSLDQYQKQAPADPQGGELRAVCLYQLGRYEDAATQYRDLSAHGEERLAWLYGQGQSLMRAGKPEQGQAAIARLFTRFPEAPETKLLEAQALIAVRKYEQAIEQLEGLRLEKLSGVDLWLGVAYENARRFPEAKQAYAREAAASGDLLAHYALGIAEARDGRDAEAAKYLERALPIDSQINNVSFHLARAYLKLNKPAAALPLLDRAIMRDPKATPPRYARLQALKNTGNFEEAQREANVIRELLRQP